MSVPKAIVASLSDGFIENTIDYNIHNKQPRTIKKIAFALAFDQCKLPLSVDCDDVSMSDQSDPGNCAHFSFIPKLARGYDFELLVFGRC